MTKSVEITYNPKGLAIVAIIAIVLICVGINGLIKKASYLETEGYYLYSKVNHDSDSDKDYYTWYYKYYVNNEEYTIYTTGNIDNKPKTDRDIVLYNPNNPSNAMMQFNNTSIIILFMGILLLIVSIGAVLIKKEQKQRNAEKKVAVYLLAIITVFVLMILASKNFSLLSLIREGGFTFMFVIMVFIAIAVYLYVREDKEKDKQKVEELYNENADTIIKANEIIVDSIVKIKSIFEIIMGSIFLLIIPFQIIMFLCFDGIFSIDDKMVSKWEFYTHPYIVFINVILFILGIVLVKDGISKIKKKDMKDEFYNRLEP